MAILSGTLAVVSQSGESLSFFDIPSGVKTHCIPNVTAELHELCYDKKRNLIYMSHTYRRGNWWTPGEFGHEISVVDVQTKEIVEVIDTRPAKAPHGFYFDEHTDTLYVTVESIPGDDGGIIGIDLETKTIIKTIGTNYRTHWFVATPDGKRALTCNKGASFISIVDLEQGKMTGRIQSRVTEQPGISPDGKRACFPTPAMSARKAPEDPSITIIDTETTNIVASIPVKGSPFPVVVSPTGTIVAGVTVPVDGTVATATLTMWDADTMNMVGEVEIGQVPMNIIFDSRGEIAFVSNCYSGTVSVVDMVKQTVIMTLDDDTESRPDKDFRQGGHGLVFIPHGKTSRAKANGH